MRDNVIGGEGEVGWAGLGMIGVKFNGITLYILDCTCICVKFHNSPGRFVFLFTFIV